MPANRRPVSFCQMTVEVESPCALSVCSLSQGQEIEYLLSPASIRSGALERLQELDQVEVLKSPLKSSRKGFLSPLWVSCLFLGKLEPERRDDPCPGDGRDLARDVPLVFEHRRMGRRGENNVR